MKESVKAEVLSSTFDEDPSRHIQVSEITLEKAKRLTETGKDVVILLDSITRLARAYNQTVTSSGKILSGGIDVNALKRPKRFFGAARNIRGGGPLNIIATALVDTGPHGDDVIFEEFKGTGNAEIKLDKKIFEKRLFPCMDIKNSSTRMEELLQNDTTLKKIHLIRKVLNSMNVTDSIEFILLKMKDVATNYDFLKLMNS